MINNYLLDNPGREAAGRDADPTSLMRELHDMFARHLPDSQSRRAKELLAELLDGGAEDAEGVGAVNARGERAGRPPEPLEPRRYGEDMAMDAAPNSARGQAQARQAIAYLQPTVGDVVLAADSAEGAFRLALDSMGVAQRRLHRDALPDVFRATVRRQAAGGHHGGVLPQGGVPYSTPAAPLARDGGDSAFARRFPNAAAIRTLG